MEKKKYVSVEMVLDLSDEEDEVRTFFSSSEPEVDWKGENWNDKW